MNIADEAKTIENVQFRGTGIRPLALTVLQNVAMVPATRTGIAQTPFALAGYTNPAAPHPAFVLRRHFGSSTTAPYSEPTRRLEGTWIYGGLIFPHWGHFLLETLARMWALRGRSRIRIVWHTVNPHPVFLPWQEELLALFGLRDIEHQFVDQPTLVDRLEVPEAGFRLGTSLHAAQALAMAVHPFRTPDTQRKIWLSRSRMKLGAIDGEGALERLLIDDGWTIVHPQEHSVQEQLALIDSAAVIGGTEGSAFHTLILAANVQARLLILARDRNVGPNYLAIAHTKNLDQTAITIATAHYDTVRMKPLFRLLDVPGTAAAVRAFTETFEANVLMR